MGLRFLRAIVILFFISPLLFAGEALLSEFVRIAPSLPDEARSKVVNHIYGRSDYLEKRFKILKSPSDLILVISESLDRAVYRAGEMVLPYEFVPAQGGPAIPEYSKVFWDYFLALAYFDANMHFREGESKAWDTYARSYALLREHFVHNAEVEEGVFLTQPGSRDFTGLSPTQIFNVAHDARLKLDKTDKAIAARDASKEVRYTQTYVFELHAYFAVLFADFLVAILHQDPLKMTSVLWSSGIPDLVGDAPFRSFAKVPNLDVNGDPLGYKFSHFFAPIRAELWKEITQSGRSQEDQLRSLESLFIRMRVVMKEILKRFDQKVGDWGSAKHFGDRGLDFLYKLGLDRHMLADHFRHGFCEENLARSAGFHSNR